MTASARTLAIIVAGALCGCTAPDWLDPAASEGEAPGLRRVLVSDDETPGRQGLLYTAMVEAEAAAQAAGLALAAADRPPEAESAAGEVLHALDPALAPGWSAKRSGIVQGWRGKGYGLRRALDETSAELRGLGAGYDEAPAEALVCLDNTRARADELADLAERALAGEGSDRREPLLRRMAEVAPRLLGGEDADGDGSIDVREGECGLQQAQALLRPLRFRARA